MRLPLITGFVFSAYCATALLAGWASAPSGAGSGQGSGTNPGVVDIDLATLQPLSPPHPYDLGELGGNGLLHFNLQPGGIGDIPPHVAPLIRDLSEILTQLGKGHYAEAKGIAEETTAKLKTPLEQVVWGQRLTGLGCYRWARRVLEKARQESTQKALAPLAQRIQDYMAENLPQVELTEAQEAAYLQAIFSPERHVAQDALENLLAATPDFAPAYRQLGDGAFQAGQMREATIYYRDFLSHAPNNPEAALRLAQTLSRQGQHAAAVPVLEQALASLQQRPATARRAEALREVSGRLQVARSQAALRNSANKSTQAALWLATARGFQHQQNLPGARHAVEKALALNPQSLEAALLRLELALAQGDAPTVTQWGQSSTFQNLERRALQGTAYRGWAHFLKGWRLLQAGRNHNALLALKAALQHGFQTAEAYHLLSQAYGRLNSPITAANTLRQGCRQIPLEALGGRGLRLEWAWRSLTSNPAETKRLAEELLTEDPLDASAYTVQGALAASEGRQDTARQALAQALLLEPGDETARRLFTQAVKMGR